MTARVTMADVEAWAKVPAQTLRELDRVDAEESLEDFGRLVWPVIEPNHPFKRTWMTSAVCEHLMAVSRGEIQKLLINEPPGLGKSIWVDVIWPAWEWGPANKPHERYLSTSHAQALKVRDNRRCRNVILSPLYQAMWGSRFRLVDDQNTKIRFDNDKTGFKIAIATSSMIGERGTRVIWDDPISREGYESEAERNAVLDWFAETMPSRVTDKARDAFVGVMQRLGAHDPSGHAIFAELGYVHLCLPMRWRGDHPHLWRGKGGRCYHLDEKQERVDTDRPLCHQWGNDRAQGDPRNTEGELLAPELMGEKAVRDLERELSSRGGSAAVSGQLDQMPSERGGGKFKTEWWCYLDRPPAQLGPRIVRRWDLAATEGGGDWTRGLKGTLLPDGRFVWLDGVGARRSPAGVEALIREVAERDGPTVEHVFPDDGDGSRKTAIARALRGDGTPARPPVPVRGIKFVRETTDKDSRSNHYAAAVETRTVYLVRAPWNDSLVGEHAQFPRGDHDDWVDVGSGLFNELIAPHPGASDHGGGRPKVSFGGRGA